MQERDRELTLKPWDAERIKKSRKMLGLSQAALAYGIGARQATVSDWERGIHVPDSGHQVLLNRFFVEEYVRNRTYRLTERVRKKGKSGVRKRKKSDQVNGNERGNLY